ncbi:diguanylate cyclase [Marinospirillum alkaliphilum]|uniref:diguanylate cyclase n=1 Tax=Marinospirillum alkaliphilum DSM 21637 TaxID=1122209 RepID=A0A1K1XJ44_9GAMM|nr:diguanylate cyclase [Marinospirillum alkaliphilum]SFX49069.1 diguanylate cyclase (GGDEF) domain-containing protein [Marinospirillum alkaliphilum DSM 21637]
MLKLQTKTLLALASVMLTLTLVITLASLASFRDFSIRAATEHTRTAAEMIRVALTESMINGTMHERDSLLKRIAQVDGLDEARVIRGKLVAQQFGDGLALESHADTIDLQVLASGQPVYTLVGGHLTPEFRATIPYIATSRGDVNCLSCHAVPEGSVLGAVTLTASIEHMRTAAILTVIVLVGATALFSIISLLFLRRLLQPLVTTASEIEHAVRQAKTGDFSVRVQQRSNDEIGAIARHFNSLSEGITSKLSEIRQNVAHLVQSQPLENGDLLADTANTVSGLVKVAQFKQAIEEDESSEEVFQRIGEVLQDEFHFETFSIYEVDQLKKQIHTVCVDGIAQAPIHWCNADISDKCTACRAVRTGHFIDGTENNLICRSFSTEARQQHKTYLCLPVIQSGGVGSVIQLVLDHTDVQRAERVRPLVESYLREAAPVLQAKRLMASLRESTLNDAMTGLRNRRFLEEYSDTLVNQCKRRETAMTLIMLDLDYFKKVNDTYGHDVGDSILVDLANIFRANVRESDLVIRYGGEEFLIILPDTDSASGMLVAEKIRKAVENHQFKAGGVLLNKTISAGLADYPNDGQAFWQVLKFADVSLYAAKERGRNQVVRFTPDLWVSEEKY